MVLGGPDPNQNTKNGMAANYFWKIAPLVVRFCQMGFLGGIQKKRSNLFLNYVNLGYLVLYFHTKAFLWYFVTLILDLFNY